jgi:hypothetical protein
MSLLIASIITSRRVYHHHFMHCEGSFVVDSTLRISYSLDINIDKFANVCKLPAENVYHKQLYRQTEQIERCTDNQSSEQKLIGVYNSTDF